MTTGLTDNDIWAIESLGRFFLDQERYQRAATVFSSLTRLHPERPYSWYGLAVLYERGGDPDSALDCYARAAERGDRAYALHHAEALLRQGHPAEASPVLTRVADARDPELSQRAIVLKRIHDL